MKETGIHIAPTMSTDRISIYDAKVQALVILSECFSGELAKAHSDIKNENAEASLQKKCWWEVNLIILCLMSIPIILSTAAATILFHKGPEIFSIAACFTLLMVVAALCFWKRRMQGKKPSSAERKMANTWRKWKSEAVALNIYYDLTIYIRMTPEYVPAIALMDVLENSLEVQAVKFQNELDTYRNLSRQDEEWRRYYYKRFMRISALSQALGYGSARLKEW